MRKLISLLLVAVILVSFVGCTGSTSGSLKEDPDEQVTLKIVYPIARKKDASLVEEAINKELETLLPNTKLEICDGTGFSEKWPLWMAAKNEFDIAHTGYEVDIRSEVNNQSLIALDDLIEEYAPHIQDLKEEYEYVYSNSKINGKLYAIPNIQVYPKNSQAIQIPVAFQSYIDTAALVDEGYASPKTTRKFWQILNDGIEKAEKAGLSVAGVLAPKYLYEGIARRGYSFITENICYDIYAETPVILDYYTTDEFKTFCEFTKSWAAKGWIKKDELVDSAWQGIRSTTTLISHIDPETKANTWQLYLLDDPDYVSNIFALDNPETRVLYRDFGEQVSYLSIPYTSKHPARAMKFLDLINSEEGTSICNLLAYGIEGKHYEVLDSEKGEIKAFEYEGQGYDVSYSIHNWMACNTMLEDVYMVSPYKREQWETAKEYYKSLKGMKKHPLFEMDFDINSYADKLGTINANCTELAPSIYSGTIANTDSLYDELMSKNKSAGLNEIIDGLQKQADDYLSSK